MKRAYALLGFLFLIVFVGAFFLIGTEKEPEYAGGPVVHTTEDVPIIPDVPKDAIPPLDRPEYVSIADSDWLLDDDVVLVYENNNDIRAYPIKIMNWHEIVNDTIGGRDVAVTYCPLCDSGIVFDRHVDDKLLSFGNTGSLYQSAMVMYDRETESYWYQAGARAIQGQLEGKTLTILPSFMSLWKDFRTEYPNALVLSKNTGYSRNYERDVFRGYDRPDSVPAFPVSISSDALPQKERIFGIVVNETAKAYPLSEVKGKTIRDIFEGKTVEVVGDPTGRTAEIFFIEDSKRMRAPVVSEFWFSWYAGHPDTRIYSSNNPENTMSLSLTSSAFEHNGKIPSKYTCDGEGTHPELKIGEIPEGTQSLALLMDDPDIPKEIKDERGIEKFDHWVLYGISPEATVLREGEQIGKTGLNSRGDASYTGPCPPPQYEPTTHRYFFRLYALDSALDFADTPMLDEVKNAMEGHIIEETELVGLYSRI